MPLISAPDEEISFEKPWQKLILDVVLKAVWSTHIASMGDFQDKKQLIEMANLHLEFNKRLCNSIQRYLQRLAEHLNSTEDIYYRN